MWEFDPVADAYKALTPMPVKRCSAIAETVNGKIYVIGGLEPLENGEGTRVTGRNEMYDPATNTWTERSPMPTSRDHAFSGRRRQQDLRHWRTHRRRQHPRDHEHRYRRGVRPRHEPVGADQGPDADGA